MRHVVAATASLRLLRRGVSSHRDITEHMIAVSADGDNYAVNHTDDDAEPSYSNHVGTTPVPAAAAVAMDFSYLFSCFFSCKPRFIAWLLQQTTK